MSNLVNACEKEIKDGDQSSSLATVKYCLPEEPVAFSWLSKVFVAFFPSVAIEILLILFYINNRKYRSVCVSMY